MTGDNITPEKIRELIADEERILADVQAFVKDGQTAGRISDESAAQLMATATRQHNASVKLLRQLLSDHLRTEWQA